MTPKSEKELHGLIENELDALEEGMGLLKGEMAFRTGTPDFLCVDSGGRLVVIEVKLHEDDSMLFQALRYYDEVDRNRHAIAQMFHEKRISPDEHPRVVLIAKAFSDIIRRLSALVRPKVELYRYAAVRDSGGKNGMVFVPVSIPMIEEPPTQPTKIQDHIDYITEEGLRPLFNRARKRIRAISDKIKEYSTQGYIGYKFEGRMLGWVVSQRKSFDVGAHVIDENEDLIDDESVRIEDKNGNYDHVLQRIRESFENLVEGDSD